MFMPGVWILWSKKKKIVIIFQKENGNTFTLLIIFIVKSLQKEQNSTNLLLWPPICRNKSAITPKWFNSLDTNSIFLPIQIQRPDQYKMKILVFSIQYDFQILKYQYQYSIWRILNKYQYQYAKKTEVSVFSISILSGKKCEKTSKPSRFEKLRWTVYLHLIFEISSVTWFFFNFKLEKKIDSETNSIFCRVRTWFLLPV